MKFVKGLIVCAVLATPFAVSTLGANAGDHKVYSGSSKEHTYKGVKIHAKELDAATTQAVDDFLKAKAEEGKTVENVEIVASNAKPGLVKHLKEKVKNKEITADEAKKKWKLTDEEAAQLK